MRPFVIWVAAIALASLAACESPAPVPHTVPELAADPVLREGILARCAADKHAAAHDVECANARLAVERTAVEEDSKHTGERGAEFERQREQLRLLDEQRRRAAERSKPGFDPYSSPVATEKPADAPKP